MILFTGFEPFGGASENPSWGAAQGAAELTREAGLDAVAVRLPCAFGPAATQLQAAVELHRPDVVICAGVAAGRGVVSLERIALNLIDARIPDNAGDQPVDVPVVEGAPLALPTRLPVKRALAALREAGVPSELSLNAGSYVCNSTFFTAVHALPASIASGFVHVPLATEVDVPTQALALSLVGREALVAGEDLRVPGGSEQ